MKGSDITTYVAVNSNEDVDIVKSVLSETDKVHVIKSNKRGVCYPSYVLSSNLEGKKDDIVVFASDDFTPPNNWDEYLTEKLKGKEGCLMVRDGYQLPDSSNMAEPVITIPIMTYGCLLKLNKIIYNPVYLHLCSDAELYMNLKDLGLLIDDRMKDETIFEHHHWAANKRQPDLNDQSYYNNFDHDKKTWNTRKNLSVEERLIDPALLKNEKEN
jgi:hypothetical protein